MDEETQKRNTDCVYFLASPLTCKKGNECEYRHSESARINPRDCWYWLGGNCLNPTCSFRHPPLDGLSGGAPSPATVPPSSSTSLPASGTANKPKVPCYFFQQGFCVKGDKCPFVHGPFPGGNLTSQKATKLSTTITEPQASGKQAVNETESSKDGKHPSTSSFSKAVQSIDPNAVQSSNPMAVKSNNFKAVQSRNPVEVKSNNFKALQSSHPVALQSNNFQAGHLGNPMTVQSNNVKEAQLQPEVRHVSQSRSQPTYIKGSPHEVDQFLPEVESTRPRVHDASRNRSRIRQSHPPEDRIQNGLESEDLLGGSSPGFDVLVDDGPDQLSHREDADYYSKHDMESGRDAINGRERNMHNKRELPYFDYDHPDSSMHDRTGYFDAEFQYDRGAYEPYKNRGYDRVGRKQPNAFDDRVLERPVVRERRSLSSEDDPERNNIEDLRHRISKRRRAGGSKVADSPSKRQHVDSRHGDLYHGPRQQDDDRRQQDGMYRDQLRQGMNHSSRRLHGRIRVEPSGFKREPSDNIEADHEGKLEKGRPRSSPGRRGLNDHFRSKYREKERGRMPADGFTSSESRVPRAQTFKNTETRTDAINFAGPKTLAQIKQEKNRESSEEPSTAQSTEHGSSQNASMKSQDKHRQNFPWEERRMRLGKLTYDSSGEQDFQAPKPLSDILKTKRKLVQVNDENEENRPTEEGQSQSIEGFNSNRENVDMPPPDKDVEEGELPAGDSYTSELPTFTHGVDDTETSNDVDALIEDKPSALSNGSKPVVMDDQEDAIMNEAVHSNEEEDVDHEEYDLEHAEHEENEEWERNGDELQEDEDYLEDDDDDDFARKLGGIFS